MNDQGVFGIDTSDYQDAASTPQFLDYKKAKAGGVSFVVTRVAYGLVRDRIWPQNYDAALGEGLITGVYQFADYRTYAQYNVQALMRLLDGRRPAFIACDLENNDRFWPGAWPSAGSALVAWVWDWYNWCRSSGLSMPLVLYTNQAHLEQMGRASSRLAELSLVMPLWLAAYQTNAPASKFAPWLKYHFWQSGTPTLGLQFGMESKEVDFNHWNGTLDELNKFAGVQVGPDPEPEVSPSEKIKDLAGQIIKAAGQIK